MLVTLPADMEVLGGPLGGNPQQQQLRALGRAMPAGMSVPGEGKVETSPDH